MTTSAAEQYLLELINRARLDPLAEAERQSIDLNADLEPGRIPITPVQVLAPQKNLEIAATQHSQWMIDNDVFSHDGENNSTAGDRMAAAGYMFQGTWGWAENLAIYMHPLPFDIAGVIEIHHDGLYESASHRTAIFHPLMNEIGIGQVGGIFNRNDQPFNASAVTQNFAFTNDQTFVTGVAYSDRDGDGFYTMGEGLPGVTISVGGNSDVTVAAGEYSVLASDNANVAVRVTHAATGQTNLTMDLRSGNGKLDVVQAADGSWGLGLSVSANLQDGIANATLLGARDLTLGGSANDNVLTGNRGNNLIMGRDGDDTISGGAGNDTLNGGSDDDVVRGDAGNDTLSDGWGSDTMTGGAGADLFILTADGAIDTIADFGPDIDQIDLRNWGPDPVLTQTAFGMTIRQGDDVLHVYSRTGLPIDPVTLDARAVLVTPSISTPTPPIDPPSNTIPGTTGHDNLIGTSGNDLMLALGGNDILDGGAGADTMEGGTGNDRYVIDHTGDVIQGEIGFSQGGGIDTVESWIDFTLPRNVEILRLQGSGDLNGTGGFAPEALVGQTGNNVLNSGGGNDVITAKAGDDTLIGGLGADSLVGDEGADVFDFNATSESRPGQENRDFINGFVNGEDRIDLSDIDANTLTGANDAFDFIGSRAFSGTAGELRYFTFGGGNFNVVEADVSGDGQADFQIFVNLTNFMTGSDFIL